MERKEKTWEYERDLNFLGERITKFTTDHWQKNPEKEH